MALIGGFNQFHTRHIIVQPGGVDRAAAGDLDLRVVVRLARWRQKLIAFPGCAAVDRTPGR